MMMEFKSLQPLRNAGDINFILPTHDFHSPLLMTFVGCKRLSHVSDPVV